jgi:RHS repeat-associated protein
MKCLTHENRIIHYYPFGAPMPGRKFTSSNIYRYGFNGKEKDDEVKGGGNSYDFGVRIYDPRLGRWLSIDPMARQYSELSPYNFCADNPIMYIDPDGQVIVVPNVADREPILKMINAKALGTFAFDESGKLYQVTSKGDSKKYSAYYRDRLVEAIKSEGVIEISKVDNKIIKRAGEGRTYPKPATTTKDPITGEVKEVKNAEVMVSGKSYDDLKDTEGKPLKNEGADVLRHELLGHAIPHIVGSDTGNAIENENKAKKQSNEPLREAEPLHLE